jgi:hypothetical protein
MGEGNLPIAKKTATQHTTEEEGQHEKGDTQSYLQNARTGGGRGMAMKQERGL